ncbi:MAG: DUF3800 domain-containing protein [Verrucomicrobiota bacterium]
MATVVFGGDMILFYLDEAGCTGALPAPDSPIQPVFIIAGIILHQDCIKPLTTDLLRLKERYFPHRLPSHAEFLDWILLEIKGADLRKQIRDGNRDERRHALGVMNNLLLLLETYNCRILGRIYVKGIKASFNGVAVYTSSVQNLAVDFQFYLEEVNNDGLMILDSRNKPKNSSVSHSIFTQKFRAGGDAYNRLVEMPLFGHSDNHAGIQCADMLCSAFLFPMATYAYCLGHVRSVHVDMRYSIIRDRYGDRLKCLQYRYQNAKGLLRGGITVSDAIGHAGGALLFGPSNTTRAVP